MTVFHLPDAPRPSFSRLPSLARKGLTCIGINIANDTEGWHEVAQLAATSRERQCATRFRYRLDATRHLVGRALVRTLLVMEAGAGAHDEFTCNAWGKPVLAGCGWAFNIAHSGSAVWAAFCQDAEVGIDCEKATALDIDSLAAFLHPGERMAILALPAETVPAALLRCWIRKEAVIKAIGEGLSRPLASFRVRTDACPVDWLAEAPATPVTDWTVYDLPEIAGTPASVAAATGSLPVSCHLLE